MYNGPPLVGNLGGGPARCGCLACVNFDLTLGKNIPLGSEKRVLNLQMQACNSFNHTEVNAIGTSIQYSPSTGAITSGSSIGIPTGTVPNRQLAISAHLQF